MPAIVHAFPGGIRFEVDHAARYCQTTFPDGSFVPATPMPDGSEQARTAAELGYPGVWAMVWHHEFCHSFLAQPGVSRVLWDVAHGIEAGDEHWPEEGRVLALQREIAAGRAGADLAAALARLEDRSC